MRPRMMPISCCVVAAVMLALGACSGDSDDPVEARSIDLPTSTSAPSTTGDGPGDTTSSSAPTGGAADFDGTTVTYELARTALRTAGAAAPNGMPFDLEVETDDDEPHFDVRVASGGAEIEVEVDITGTRVLSTEEESDPDDAVDKVASATIDATTALDRAEALHPDARVEEMEIDRKDSGVVVWEIDLRGANGAEIDLDIDATSGEVVAG